MYLIQRKQKGTVRWYTGYTLPTRALAVVKMNQLKRKSGASVVYKTKKRG